MPRLLSWPNGLVPKEATPLSGPRSVGSGSTESTTSFVQTRSSPFGLWRWQFTFDRMVDVKARRYRGLITALHAGANAVRVPWMDGNPIRPALWGVSQHIPEQPWSNNQQWSNGRGWGASAPLVQVASASPKGAFEVYLGPQFWVPNLGYGDIIGFTPFHFGWYMVTENMGGGRARIWPPLRAPITANHYATLNPVLVMRLDGEQAATFKMEVGSTSESTMNLVEVEDAHVREHFVD